MTVSESQANEVIFQEIRNQTASGKGSRAQNINFVDAICEGPVRGLVGGASGVFLNDVAAIDPEYSTFNPLSEVSAEITFTGSSYVGTVSGDVNLEDFLPDDSGLQRMITLNNYRDIRVTITNIAEVADSNNVTLTLEATDAEGTPFDDAFNTGNGGFVTGVTAANHVLLKEGISVTGYLKRVDGDTVTYDCQNVEGAFNTTDTYIIRQRLMLPVSNVTATTVTVSDDINSYPAAGDYRFSLAAPLFANDPGSIIPAAEGTRLSRIRNLNVHFEKGTLSQAYAPFVGGVGGAVGVPGNVSNVSGPVELNQLDSTRAAALGITTLDEGNLPLQNGYPDYSVQNSNETVLPASAFGLTSAVKIKEADSIYFNIEYPGGLQLLNLHKGKKEDCYALYVMHMRVKQGGAFLEWKQLFPGDRYVRHRGNTNAGISFSHEISLDGYRRAYGGVIEDFEVRVVRVTRQVGMPVDSTGKCPPDRTDRDKWQIIAKSRITAPGSTIKDILNYPYTALASVSFSSKQFNTTPKASYLMEGKIVKIPDTYTPREYSDTGIAKYDGFWDGTFKQGYTDNPAWVFYDIVTNNRYGAGKWISADDIDHFALYRIAQYCDEFVKDGVTYTSANSIVKGEFYRIETAGDTDFTSVGAPDSNVGTEFRATATSFTGTGEVCGIEPRYRANIFLTKATDVYKVLKDFATTFLGILYWQDSKIVAVQDSPQDAIYTFTKGNVIDGTFAYESSGRRTRMNQIVVTYNDPELNYEPTPIVVEDAEDIIRTGRIISNNAVAFGATSRGQAMRYARWKLWTAINQTEVVSFKTGLAGHYVRPGDVINVQDADRYGVSYSGRTKSATSNTITFDRNVTFNSATTYELSTVVTEPAAFYASVDDVRLDSSGDLSTLGSDTLYTRGDRITTDLYVWNSSTSAYESVNIDTEEKASNAYYKDGSDYINIPLTWKPHSFVETKAITNPGTSSNTVTLADSATFEHTPSANTIWALRETSGGLNVNGSIKKYKVLSVMQDENHIFGITAAEYYDEKYDAVEKDYDLGTIPDTIFVEAGEDKVIPPPKNLRVILATDAQKPGEELVLEWDKSDSDYVSSYEVTHNISNQVSPMLATDTKVNFSNLPNGDITFKVRAVSGKGNYSKYVAIDFSVLDPYEDNIPRMPGGIPKGAFSTAQGKVNSSNQYEFQATNTSLFSVGTPYTGKVITGTKDISNISTGIDYYLYLDASVPSIKLMERNTSALSGTAFYRDVGSGNTALSAAWTSIGTVSVEENSNKVTGSGFNANVKLRDVINLENSTSPSDGDGGTVISIISDTELLIDKTFDTAKTNITGYRANFRPDYLADCIFSQVTKTGSTITAQNFLTVKTLSDDTEGTIETQDDGTIAVRDGGISVDKIAANSINADKIQANSITTDQLAANSITTDQLAANSITADQITANSVVSSLISASTIQSSHIKSNSIVATIIDATTINASDITTNTLSALSANMGDITAGTLKGGNIPDANDAPASGESGAFLDLTGGKMVFGDNNKYILFDGTDLELNGVTIDASSTINATAAADITVKEDGTSVGTGIASFNFTTGLDLSVSGTEVTVSATDQTPSWVPATDPNYLTGITTAQVRTAGALMDDELTDLVGVKGVTISTLQPKPSEGAFVDGDKTKLDGIATNANNYSLPTATSTVLGGVKIGSGININSGTISAATQSDENFTSAFKTKLEGVATNANNYSLPTATASVLGGVKIGTGINIDANGVITAGTQSEENFTSALKTKLEGIETSANNYSLPIATSTVLGGVKDGARITINANGVISADVQTANDFTNALKNKLDNIAENANAYSLPTASATVLGGVKIGTGISISSGTISADTQSDENFTSALKTKLNNIEAGATGDQSASEIRTLVNSATDSNVFTDAEKTKLSGIATSANNYSLPVATSSALGGIEVGYTTDSANRNYAVQLNSNDAYVNVPWQNTEYSQATASTLGLVKIGYTENNKNYPVELSNGQMFVNVPWTDNNTTYTAGSGLSLSGSNEFSVNNTVVRTTGTQTIGGDKTFSNNVVVSGNLTVSGTTTTINTTNLTIEDNIIVVNSAQAGTPASTVTAGLEVERGDSTNKRFVYAETGLGPDSNLDGWSFGSERVEAGTFYGTFVGDVTGTPSSLSGLTTDNLAEGTNNLYYTDTRVIAALSGGSGIDKSAAGEFSVDSTVIRTTGAQTLAGVKTFSNGIVASGGISGLTLTNGISGSNFNITGVNQLSINDPGEGIVFTSGSSGNMVLAIVDDASDNILRYSGTNAVFDVQGNITLSGTVDGRDIATDGSKLDGIATNANNYSLPANNVTNASVSGNTLTLSRQGATDVTFTDTNTTYSVGDGGLTQKNFTTTLKDKLDNIAANATNTAAPAISTNGSTPALASGITGAEVRNLIGAGTSSLTLGTTSTTALRGDTAIPTVNNPAITLSAGNSGITMDSDNSFTLNQSGAETITISHADTSSQGSVDNSGGTVIQDITLDTFGHITAINSTNLDGRYFTETESDARYLRKDYNNNWTRLGYGTSGTAYWHKLVEVTINGSYKDYQLRCDWTDRYGSGQLAIHIHSDNDNTADVWNAMIIQNGVTNRKAITDFKYYQSGSTVQVWVRTAGWREFDYIRTDAVTEGAPTIVWYKEGDSGVGKTTTEPTGLTTFADYSPWNQHNDGAGSGLNADLLDGNSSDHYLNYNNLTNKPTIPTNNNQLTNGAGYITGISSTDVTTALGFTPYNATNPNGYITGISSTDVTTALGFTPYNATNPNGYITNSGGTTTSTASTVVKRNSVSDISVRAVRFDNKEKSDITIDGQLGFDSSQGLLIRRVQQNVSAATVTVLDGANVAAGTGLSISNLGSGTSGGGTGTQKFTFSLANTAVSPGSYTNADITVDAQGRIIAASNGTGGGTDLTTLTDMTQTILETDEFVVLDSNAPRRKAASEVISDLNIVTGNVTGTLFADVIVANKIETDMLKANTITADKIAANLINADKIAAGSITAEQLQISNNASGSAGIYMDYNGGNSRIDIRDSSALRVRIGYLA